MPSSSFTVRPPVSFPRLTSPSNSFHSVALRYGTYLWNCLTNHGSVCAHVEQATAPASRPSCPRPPTVQVLKTLRCSDAGCSARIWFCSSISSSRRTSVSALLLLEGRIEQRMAKRTGTIREWYWIRLWGTEQTIDYGWHVGNKMGDVEIQTSVRDRTRRDSVVCLPSWTLILYRDLV